VTNHVKRLALAIAGSKYDRPEAALPRLTREQLESQIRAYSPDAIAVLKELKVIAAEDGRPIHSVMNLRTWQDGETGHRDTEKLIRIFIDEVLEEKGNR